VYISRPPIVAAAISRMEREREGERVREDGVEGVLKGALDGICVDQTSQQELCNETNDVIFQ